MGQRSRYISVFRASARCLAAGFAVFVLAIFFTAVAPAQVDTFQQTLDMLPNDTVRADSLIQRAKSVMGDDLKQAEDYARKALQYSLNVNYTKGEALSYRYIGLSLNRQSDFGGAVEFYTKGLTLFDKLGDLENKARMLSNLGSVYESISNDMKALEYNLKAQRVAEQIQDPLISAERLIAALNNIGVIYAKKEQTRKKALEIFEKALDQATRLQDAELESKFCSNIGETYYDLGDYEKALQYFDKAIEKYNGVESLPYVQLNKGKVFTKRKQYAMAEEIQREALANLEKVDSKRDMAAAFNALANTLYLKGDLDGSILAYEKAVELGRSLGVLEEPFEAYGGLAKVYSAKGEYRMAYEYHLMESQVSDSLYDIAYRQQLESFHFDDQIKDKDHKLSLETKERELAQERAQSQKKAKIAFQIGMGLVLVILFILFRNFRNKVRINKLLDSQKAKIETLLLNILPASVAKELEKNGQAAPRFYDSVSVLFTDFKDFTRIADTMTPREIVDELNDFFTAFDDITERHGLEKIKTIGDAYMCAGGIPVENETHPVDIIRAAIDIVDYMAMKNVIRKEQGKNPWNLRVGIHTGPIAAGVVGKRKYAYDIWGSSVNIASRMESNGEPGKINISSATYELVKDKFKCTYRGKISAKNIGEIDMYFVEHEIREPELVS